MSETVYTAIENALKNSEPLLIGRFGTIEFEAVYWVERFDSEFPEKKRELLERNAGIFPSDMGTIRRWAACVKEAVCAADVLAVGWYPPIAKDERELLEKWGWCGGRVGLRDLEPYYVEAEKRWTRLLGGQEVCVVTSFCDTARRQLAKGERSLWPSASGSIFPDGVAWHWVQTGYSPVLAYGRCGWEESPESWEEAADWVVGEVLKTGAKIVLIGCGGLGMVIGGRLRAAGKICIVMGGALQVLFGIKGGRWASHPVISGFWNSDWVWPSLDETPGGAMSVEEGCYWKA